ncbi:MAG: PEGA domain-containing protein [Candidatus Marinimicrobia bacterium]|nr:PEGA domain-containing protein [Candidatus Neomarinimicrobiota bacterium]
MKILSRIVDPTNRLICWIFLITLCLSPLIAQDLPTVAIMEFESSGMSETDAANITSRFGYELSKTNRFRITERQMMEEILNEQKFQMSGCTSSECVVEVGQLLSVKYMIADEVSKTFDLYSLHVRIISVESGEVIAQVIEDYEGSARDFITGTVRNAALKLAAEARTSRGSSSGELAKRVVTKTGQVSFTLNISHVNVFIDDNYSGENNTKTVSLSLPMGDHTVKLSAPGYQDYEKVISVLPDQNIEYSVEMQPGTTESVSDINTGIVVVRSIPEGAGVYFDGLDVGTTPVQIPKAGTGKHLLRIEKTLYHNYLEEISVQPDGIIQVLAELDAAFGSLTIVSTPAGAVVSLNEQVKSRTPLTINELASGEYEITITKDLYHTHTERFIITDGSSNTRDITLLPAFGQLIIDTEPIGATISLDGQNREQTPASINELPSGTYTLRVEKDLYQPVETTILIEDGKTNKKDYILESRFGTLNITGTPVSAQVIINGSDAGVLPLRNYKVSAGLVKITVKEDRFHDKTLSQQVNIGDIHNLDIQLERHTGTVVVLTAPPGAAVNLNDKNYGDSPKILKDMPTGLYGLAVTHPDYLSVNRNFSLALNERKEFNIKLMTYAGSIQQEIDRVKRKRNINIASAGLLGITAGIIKIMSINAYNDYENAAVTADALNFYDKANSLNKLSGYIGIAAGISATPIIKWQIDIGKLGRK